MGEAGIGATAGPPVEAMTGAGGKGVGRTVLVVEDDPAVLATVVEALAGEGYVVRRATNGMDALRQVNDAPPDLVVSDVHMPQLSDAPLVRRLRAVGVPIVLMSGDPNFARSPGVAFVPKPFDVDHLLDVVAYLLDESGEGEGRALSPDGMR